MMLQALANLFHARSAQLLPLLAATLLLPCWGCGAQDSNDSEATRVPTVQSAQPDVDRPSTSDSNAATRSSQPLPAPGRVEIELLNGYVSILSNSAPRSVILQTLAASGGFALELGDLVPHSLTLRIENQALEQALPLVLEDIPYWVDYSFDPTTGRHVVAFLGAGLAPRGSGLGIASRDLDETPQRLAKGYDRESLEALYLQRRLEEQPVQAALLADLNSPHGSIRFEAASDIDAEGPALDRLLEILAEDPDPAVRAAAVKGLADAGSHWAVRGLIFALDDSETSVVLLAIEALESEGDESVALDLEPLLDHRDSEVREAASEALDSLL